MDSQRLVSAHLARNAARIDERLAGRWIERAETYTLQDLLDLFTMAISHEAINRDPATAVPSVSVPRNEKNPVPVKDLDDVRVVVPDYRAATDRLAPGPETSDGPTPGL